MGSVEVEVKLRVRGGLRELVELLDALGYLAVSDEAQLDVYFSHPCYDFSSRDEALRLRVSGGRAVLCYKGPRQPSRVKKRLEVEVAVSDASSTVRLLKALGFRELARIEKRRRVFKRSNVTIALDEVKGLGPFVEVEAPSESAVLKAMYELGFSEKDIVRETYLELALKSKKSSNTDSE